MNPATAGSSGQPQKSKLPVINFKVDKPRNKRFRMAAKKAGKSLSAWLRDAGDAACKDQGID